MVLKHESPIISALYTARLHASQPFRDSLMFYGVHAEGPSRFQDNVISQDRCVLVTGLIHASFEHECPLQRSEKVNRQKAINLRGYSLKDSLGSGNEHAAGEENNRERQEANTVLTIPSKEC